VTCSTSWAAHHNEINASHERACLPPLPAQEPAKECAEHEPGLRCKRDIDCHAEDDAKRQTQHGSEPDGGSHTHARESTFPITSARDSGPVSADRRRSPQRRRRCSRRVVTNRHQRRHARWPRNPRRVPRRGRRARAVACDCPARKAPSGRRGPRRARQHAPTAARPQLADRPAPGPPESRLAPAAQRSRPPPARYPAPCYDRKFETRSDSRIASHERAPALRVNRRALRTRSERVERRSAHARSGSHRERADLVVRHHCRSSQAGAPRTDARALALDGKRAHGARRCRIAGSQDAGRTSALLLPRSRSLAVATASPASFACGAAVLRGAGIARCTSEDTLRTLDCAGVEHVRGEQPQA
jgi:hypothetical protein